MISAANGLFLLIPGDGRTVKLTFILLNEMKSDMTYEEFEYYILQFAKFFTTGQKIIKKKLKYWFRLLSSGKRARCDQ